MRRKVGREAGREIIHFVGSFVGMLSFTWAGAAVVRVLPERWILEWWGFPAFITIVAVAFSWTVGVGVLAGWIWERRKGGEHV